MPASAPRRPFTSAPWRGLTVQLFAITILPLGLLVLVVSLGSAYLHQQAMRRMVGERDELAVRAAASALSAEINHRLAAVRGLALQAANTSAAAEDVLSSADYLLADFDLGLALLSRDGQIIALRGENEYWESLTREERSVFAPNAATEAGVAEVFLPPTNGSPSLVFHALSPQGNLIAIGALSTEALARQALSEALPASGEARLFIVDAQYRILFESGAADPGRDLSRHPGVREALQGESGTVYLAGGYTEHVAAYSYINAVGWALVMEEPWETVTTPYLRTTEVAPLALAPVLLIALAVLWFGVRQIVQPLQRLEQRAAALAWGDFQAVDDTVGGIAEIRRLQSELAHMAARVEAAQRSLHDYIGVITAAQEEERRRLARELHDDTLQALIALKQRALMARKSLRGGAAAESLAELADLTEQTIDNLRRLTRALRPTYLEDLGLVTALEMLARETQEATSVAVDFFLEGEERRLEPVIELALYRMAQEALSNVARHARAERARLSIRFKGESVLLEISDNGQGFNMPASPSEFAAAGHFGLLGLYERAELIGAKLDLQSGPGQGTRLTISLPAAGLEPRRPA